MSTYLYRMDGEDTSTPASDMPATDGATDAPAAGGDTPAPAEGGSEGTSMPEGDAPAAPEGGMPEGGDNPTS